MPPEPTSHNHLKDKLFERIETDRVCPKSRWFFFGRECVVWSLWMLSVLVGAFAVAVSTFVLLNNQYAFYEATHDNFFTFLMGALPYIWFVALSAMVVAAVYNWRHTKRGYRYSLLTIVGGSLIVSIGGGAVLHMLGLGYALDRELGVYVPLYKSQIMQERELWQVPAEGRLVGRQVSQTASNTIVFVDVTGAEWKMDVSAMNAADLAVLATEHEVRVLGLIATSGARDFSGCGAFPWLLGKPMSKQVLTAERQRFLERVYELGHTPDDRLAMLQAEVITPTRGCASLPVVRRMMQQE